MIEYNTLTLAVEGYPSQLSYQPGEEVAFHCSARTAPFQSRSRIGVALEVVWQRTAIPGTQHPTPPDAYANGCGWPVSFTFTIPTEWRSGFYEVAVRRWCCRGKPPSSHVFLSSVPSIPVVTRRFLLVLSTNTYNAYNKWGGECLYTGMTQVSFARPMERGLCDQAHRPRWL